MCKMSKKILSTGRRLLGSKSACGLNEQACSHHACVDSFQVLDWIYECRVYPTSRPSIPGIQFSHKPELDKQNKDRWHSFKENQMFASLNMKKLFPILYLPLCTVSVIFYLTATMLFFSFLFCLLSGFVCFSLY